jgi:hypothetical protein
MAHDFICGEEYKPLIRDGTYEAQCIDFNSKFYLGKTRKLFLHFKILTNGEYFGERIFQAFNMPYNRRIRQGSKYYKTWVMVNDWKKPTRNAKMSPRLFKNKIFKIKTRTVKPMHNRKEMPQHFWYSVVDEIIEVIE